MKYVSITYLKSSLILHHLPENPQLFLVEEETAPQGRWMGWPKASREKQGPELCALLYLTTKPHPFPSVLRDWWKFLDLVCTELFDWPLFLSPAQVVAPASWTLGQFSSWAIFSPSCISGLSSALSPSTHFLWAGTNYAPAASSHAPFPSKCHHSLLLCLRAMRPWRPQDLALYFVCNKTIRWIVFVVGVFNE